MTDSHSVAPFVQGYFHEFLAAQKGLSPNTILSYRDSLKLLLRFGAARVSKGADKLAVEDFDEKTIMAFLNDLEASRGNSFRTRNARLTAIRSFFRYVAHQEPAVMAHCQRICGIPLKRTQHITVQYLEEKEVQAVLESIDPNSQERSRDYALLLFLYNSGARVQETVSLIVRDLRLTVPYQVRLCGKGRKERVCPLWPETASALQNYFDRREPQAQATDPVFLNGRGQHITRFGIRFIVRRCAARAKVLCPSIESKKVSPHTMRHYVAFRTM